ncbi:MAG: mechanosensitive ion channel protein MscS [Bacteroidetes bacterium]|nr:MAG: mechanosensitive ion channel protein MscS [Bacteroidota bacterium]
MIENLLNWYHELLSGLIEKARLLVLIENTTIIVATILLAMLADFLVKRFIITAIKTLVKRSKNKWDDIFLERGVFNRLAHLAPALVVKEALHYLFDAGKLITFLENLTHSYMAIVVLLVVDAAVNALHEVYLSLPFSKGRNIRGFVQVIKIIFYLLGIIFIISIFSPESPKALVASLGGMAAVLILVFRDTILGFVASIQLVSNKMVKVGDWISMPKYGADGTVLDINLTSVMVQNWDKTIATIPTYALVSDSFNNWKGMEESGGRRIKRSINIDMSSVRFLDEEMKKKLSSFYLLKDYLQKKDEEIAAYNKSLNLDDSTVTNGRRLTNLGTFRAYLENYLHQHPRIHQGMTFLVRHLQSTEKGLPIEIYVFSNDQAWTNYEAIQADIFDHILAILPEFDLRVFQNPTGADFNKIMTRPEENKPVPETNPN